MMVDEIVANIPPANIVGIELMESGHRAACRSSLYTWRGHTRIFIQGTPDFEKVRLSARAALVTKDAYAIEFQPGNDYLMPGMDIRDAFGSRYMAAPNSAGTHYDILSFSPCEEMPDEPMPGGTV